MSNIERGRAVSAVHRDEHICSGSRIADRREEEKRLTFAKQSIFMMFMSKI